MDSGNSPRFVSVGVAVAAAAVTTPAVAVPVAPAAVATGGFLRWAFDFFPILIITITMDDVMEDDGFLCSVAVVRSSLKLRLIGIVENVDVFYFSMINCLSRASRVKAFFTFVSGAGATLATVL